MAKVRYIGSEPVTVPELFGQERTVQPDEVVTVPDERFAGYVCQPRTWEAVEEPADWNTPEPAEPQQDASPAAPAARTALKKTAAKSAPQKEEG
ncbi:MULTISPECIES: hypothetical protein [Streptomyces]|uniref:hypothetical protein n=1 Tax=Streptomyces TaxID=1883 RepID=UPI0029B2D159|nr:hypothetical protein [Streptomyces stelliscabiei]MDX2520592.1 hypothetical protein [Streptomyces stelliscabiei]MDX2552689.1 hypothetical protein [Streptomyces stelliscabiei]MDX2661373.1 hypothetical protein [Streptomyces stelliscabiei]MDX2788854.1 hypothetical protein [Streptomyces stelliscabiei]